MYQFTMFDNVNAQLLDTRTEWLKQRKSIITATSASAIMGINPWEQPIDIYVRIKTGIYKEQAESGAMALGNKFEPLARNIYRVRHSDVEVHQPPENGNWLFTRKDKKYFGCTPDGLVFPQAEGNLIGGVECKYHLVKGRDDYEEWLSGKLPQHYYVQGLHSLNTFKGYASFWDYAVILEHQRPNSEGVWVFDHYEYREYRLLASELKDELAYEEKCVDDFYNNHLAKNIPPKVTITL